MKDNKNLASSLVFIVCFMGVITYASVPLYSIFCKVTGFGGTPKIAKDYVLPKVKGRNIKIRFDSNIDSNLNWKFYPKQKEINVKAGDVTVVFYTAENLIDKPITGTAIYNVTPNQAGIYFNKIECFCFEEQTLLPLEKQDMPVSFFIDPEIDNDIELKNTDTITLSYSFFKVK